ncbi:neuronal growth regulator 1 isoform X9 [Ascaphus truei]|uniref:neuronal growth regulator 1 isoform X9 n=1 Tax=Ascaphus truei TaxID=8439 RepID=UPI003F59CF4D
MDMMMLVQGAAACCSNQWLAAVILSLCCLLPSCLPGGQSMDFPWPAVDSLVVRQGDTAMLRCYLEDGASKGAWLNRSSIIFAGGDKWSVDPRVSIASSSKKEYSLRIQKVDIADDGPYTCSVQTEHSPRTMQVHLIVQVSPKIYDISSDMVVNEGTNVSLTCLAAGKPEPSISWRHISPSVAPTILEISPTGVSLGRTGLIRCETAAVPPPIFEWYKGEKKLTNGQKGIVIKNYNTRSILTVSNVTVEHFGNYTCVAVNKLGTSNASLPLNQIVEPSTSSPVTSSAKYSVKHFARSSSDTLHYTAPSTAQYGITGSAEILFSCWHLALTLSSLSSILYLKNAILQ